MSLFADTSGLYALLVATEADHDAVKAAFRRAAERGRRILSVRFVDEPLHRKGLERLFRLDRRRVSLVDAVSFEVLEDEGISDVLGLDRHVTEQGFRLIP